MNTIDLSSLSMIGTGVGIVGQPLTFTDVAISPAAVIPDIDAVDLVVEYHIDPTGGLFYPGGNQTTETHNSFLSSEACGLSDPVRVDEIVHTGPEVDFRLIMVVTLEDSPVTDMIFMNGFEN